MPKTSTAEAKKRKGLLWLADFYDQAYVSFDRLMRVINVSRRGISSIRALPDLVMAIVNAEGKVEDSVPVKLIEEDAALAKSEIDKDFPVLHSLAVVALWSWLEHLIKGLLAESLARDPKCVQSIPFNKIKVKLSDYLPLSKKEQATYLVELLEQETSASLKHGINRFESLLATIGISGHIPASTAKAIFELQEVRNAIVHQNGRCDRRLRSSCPWLNTKIGKEITISSDQLNVYSNAVADYAVDVLYRIADKHGVNLREMAMPPNKSFKPKPLGDSA